MSTRIVREWMTPQVVVITPETTLPDAHKLMQEHGIRRLPVVKDGKLVGIVTLSDIREAKPSDATSLSIWEMNYLLAKLTIKQLMSSPVITTAPETAVGEAAKTMLNSKISALPVVDRAGKLVGIITESDVFRMLVAELNKA
ncbi:MAG: CBS domain-containing protein [Gammaproteobacteria bacterium]